MIDHASKSEEVRAEVRVRNHALFNIRAVFWYQDDFPKNYNWSFFVIPFCFCDNVFFSRH